MKISELTGAALDWAVAKCEYRKNHDFDDCVIVTRYLGSLVIGMRRQYGDSVHAYLRYSSDWAQGGPIIEREWLDVTPWPNESDESLRWQCQQHDNIDCLYFGRTAIEAAMRCYVASKLGDEIEIPAQLITP